MKHPLTVTLAAATMFGTLGVACALAQETTTGAPRGTAPATIEGYGPSSAIVCDDAGTTCWHSVERYDYPPDAHVVVHPYNWQSDNGANFAWREHKGRGYWRGSDWEEF
jgi:hypothetical protein